MTDTTKLRFGPTPWTCTVCGHENAMHIQDCQNCSREARRTLTDGTGSDDAVCKYGCSRDRLIHELVVWNIVVMDAARDVFDAIALARDGAPAVIVARLVDLHINLARPLAEQSNELFDQIGPINGDHRPFDWAVSANNAARVEPGTP